MAIDAIAVSDPTKVGQFRKAADGIVAGDIVFCNAAGDDLVRLAIGAAGEFLKVAGGIPAWQAGGAGGDNISVNGVNAVDADFDDITPNAPADGVNVRFQKDGLTPNNISANVREATAGLRGVIALTEELSGTAGSPTVVFESSNHVISNRVFS